jgi:UDP-glucose 4-epimerase
MNILLTGGTGFIGGRILRRLKGRSNTIKMITRKKEKVTESESNNHEIILDWSKKSEILNACEGIDCIIHAAGANAHECARNPFDALMFNGGASIKLGECAVEMGVKKIIYLSTAHVYRSPLIGEINERTLLENHHPYATSQVAGESAVMWASRKSQTQTYILRLSNVFGRPGNNSEGCWTLFVNDICRSAVEKQRIVIKNDPNTVRDFLAMDKLLDTIELIVSKEEGEARIVNVGSHQSMTLGEMAERVRLISQKLQYAEPSIEYRFPGSSIKKELLYNTLHKDLSPQQSPEECDRELEKLLIYCQRKQFKNGKIDRFEDMDMS